VRTALRSGTEGTPSEGVFQPPVPE